MKHLLLLLLFTTPIADAQIYKWVDADGRVHFGDSPQKTDRAERVEVQVNSFESLDIEALNTNRPQTPPEKPTGKVVMYSTSWCGFCKKARNYFKAKGIPFTEHDIEKDPSAHQRFKALGGSGVPLILVGKKRMSGFSPQRFESLLR